MWLKSQICTGWQQGHLLQVDMFVGSIGFKQPLKIYKFNSMFSQLTPMTHMHYDASASWCHFQYCPWKISSAWAECMGWGEVGRFDWRVKLAWMYLGLPMKWPWSEPAGPKIACVCASVCLLVCKFATITSPTPLPCDFTATMSSLAQLWAQDNEKQRQRRHDDTRLTESGNATSDQLFVSN